MKLTSKGRYAVMAMADLAKINTNRPTNLTDISSYGLVVKKNTFIQNSITQLYSDGIYYGIDILCLNIYGAI